jgi:hypothetical protein
MDNLAALGIYGTAFIAGERVFLAEGPHTCTVGIFVAMRPDVNWAEIKEPNDLITTHPVRWLRHCPEGDLNWRELMGQA